MDRKKDECWTYTDVSCAIYSLNSVDTVSEHGECDQTSALYSIINSDSHDHLNMIDDFIINLLKAKWKTLIKKRFFFISLLFKTVIYLIVFPRFIIEFILFVIYLALLMTTVVLERAYFDYLENHTSFTEEAHNGYFGTMLKPEFICANTYFTDPNAYVIFFKFF